MGHLARTHTLPLYALPKLLDFSLFRDKHLHIGKQTDCQGNACCTIKISSAVVLTLVRCHHVREMRIRKEHRERIMSIILM